MPTITKRVDGCGSFVRRSGAATLAGLLCCGVLGWAPCNAQTDPVPALTLRELEQSFWACDRLATTTRVGAGDAACCSLVTEAFLRHRFDGDFTRLLQWWNEQKSSQPDSLERPRCVEARAPHWLPNQANAGSP